MNRPDRPDRPNPGTVLAALKPFQQRTVEHAFERLFLAPDSTARFLVADEVGLGKTLVARGVIARAIDHLWDSVPAINILYVCSNQSIARANLPKLRVGAEHSAELATRLTLLATQLAPRDQRPGLNGHPINFVSLTPGTSFARGHSSGAREEREVLFALLSERFAAHRTALMNLLQGKVTRWEDWRWRLTESPPPIERGIAERFLARLDAAPDLGREIETLLVTAFARRRERWPGDISSRRNQLIARLRTLLSEVCVGALEPHLVVLDEFQRFRELLETRPSHQDPAAGLFQELVRISTAARQPVRTLLLSATPYKLYTADAEIDQEDHYEDFLATTRFLLGGVESEVDGLRGVLAGFGRALRRGTDGDTGEITTHKCEAERSLLRIMCRTERVGASADHDGMVEERRPLLELTVADVQQYLAADAIFRAVGDGDPMPFWKSAPYLVHFMRGYGVNARLQRVLAEEPEQLVEVLRAHAPALLAANDVRNWKPLLPAHAKLAHLAGELLDRRGLWQLLWMPPTRPYWELGGAYEGQDHATKALIFSAWNLVPDVIAGWLSYEAERRMVRGRMEHYQEPERQAVRRLRLSAREGRSRHRLLLLLLPCLALADRAHPLAAPAGIDRRQSVRERVAALLGDPGLPDPAAGPIDHRWEWAFPLLLDPGLSGLLVAWRDGDIQAPDGTPLEPPNPDAFAGYVDDFLGLDLRELGRRPPGLLDLVTEVALGAPGVLAARTLASAGLPDAQRRGYAVAVADACWRLFNRPSVIALLDRDSVGGQDAGGDDVYWRRVISYCIDGNLQSVLDETWHLQWEQHAWSSGEDTAPVAQRCAWELAEVIEPSVSRVHAQFLTVTKENRVKEQEEIRLRTDFALRFGDARGESAGAERAVSQDKVRKAFNSPFRPFVLASTSIGQEGLDFHPWCHRVVHWNLPGNPVDLEQREGRVNRYKGHAVRRNVAEAHGREAIARWRLGDDLWRILFDLADAAARERGDSDLVPYWVAPGIHRVQRQVPLLPYAQEIEHFERLKRQLAAYRVVFGQPRQEELLALLAAADVDVTKLRDWAIDLSPSDVPSGPDMPGPIEP